MKGRKNVMLVELIAVIFFFAISTAVTLQVFFEAYRQSTVSNRMTTALVEIESWAERIAMTTDVDELLADWTRESEGDTFTRTSDYGYFLTMTYEAEGMPAGTMMRFTLTAYDAVRIDSPLLLTMPILLYLPGSGDII